MRHAGLLLAFAVLAAAQLPWVDCIECVEHTLHLAGVECESHDHEHDHDHGHGHPHDRDAPPRQEDAPDHEHERVEWHWTVPAATPLFVAMPALRSEQNSAEPVAFSTQLIVATVAAVPEAARARSTVLLL